MIFEPAPIGGVYVVEVERIEDARGYFARTFSEDEFERRSLVTAYPEHSASFNKQAGTLRGIHFQREPFLETKVVRCAKGSIFDVAVDLRPWSQTFKQSFCVELSEANSVALYVPAGCGHGFMSLVDDTTVEYQISVRYRPDAAAGIRWDDPELQIPWPMQPTCLSERDATLPHLTEALEAGGL